MRCEHDIDVNGFCKDCDPPMLGGAWTEGKLAKNAARKRKAAIRAQALEEARDAIEALKEKP